jgi:carboxylesterase type B
MQTLAPVLVYLHGGGFVWGDGNVDPVYFMDSKIVVVTLNYRLGPLGERTCFSLSHDVR